MFSAFLSRLRAPPLVRRLDRLSLVPHPNVITAVAIDDKQTSTMPILLPKADCDFHTVLTSCRYPISELLRQVYGVTAIKYQRVIVVIEIGIYYILVSREYRLGYCAPTEAFKALASGVSSVYLPPCHYSVVLDRPAVTAAVPTRHFAGVCRKLKRRLDSCCF